MLARDIMTPEPWLACPDTTIADAAATMAREDVGMLPVVDDPAIRRLVGVITDRDMAVRCLACHHKRCVVADHMTRFHIQTVSPDADVTEALALMERHQLRRLPVVDAAGTVVGIISQADVGLVLGQSQPGAAAALLHHVSVPAAERKAHRESF